MPLSVERSNGTPTGTSRLIRMIKYLRDKIVFISSFRVYNLNTSLKFHEKTYVLANACKKTKMQIVQLSSVFVFAT